MSDQVSRKFCSIEKLNVPRKLHASPGQKNKLTTAHILGCIIKNKRLSPISRKNYTTKLKLLEKQRKVSLLNVICQARKSLKHVSKTYSETASRKICCASVLAVIKHCPRLRNKVPADAIFCWKGALRECNQAIQSRYDTHEPSERQKNSFVSYDELQEEKSRMPHGCYARLLISLFVDMQLVRAGDYHRVRLILNQKKCPKCSTINEPNFIWVPQDESQLCRLVLRQYKTAAHNGPLVRFLPLIVSEELRANLNITGDREWLFLNPLGHAWPNSGYFGKWAARILKRLFPSANSPGLGLLRHAYLNHFRVGSLSDSHRAEIAKNMYNSVAIQGCYLFNDDALAEMTRSRRMNLTAKEINITLVGG